MLLLPHRDRPVYRPTPVTRWQRRRLHASTILVAVASTGVGALFLYAVYAAWVIGTLARH